MRIVRLTAENFKRLKAIEITPDPDSPLVTITGRNGQGKSSVLDAIAAALSGRELPELPIRSGENAAHIAVDCGEFVIKRSITASGARLTVENKEGFAKKSPQKFLEERVGSVSIDPMAFTRLKPSEQRAILCRVVGVDVDAYLMHIAQLTEERRQIGRERDRLAGYAASLPAHADAPAAEVSVTDLMEEYNRIQEHNRVAAARVGQLGQLKDEAIRVARKIDDLLDEAKQMQAHLEAVNADYEVTKAECDKPDNAPQSTDAIRARLGNVEVENKKVRANTERTKAAVSAEKAEAEYVAKTEEITRTQGQLDAKLHECKLPVEDLSITGTEILSRGIPFAQLSSSEKIKISTAIAMSEKPDIKVLRVTDGSLLDTESMATLEAIARENDYQVWIEVVDDSPTSGFIIEDGAVVSAPAELQAV